MKKNHNPNCWSELPLDLLTLVFERLGFANFQQAETVCSSWYSASRQSVPKNNPIRWLKLFPEDKNNKKNKPCMLFNPDEKDKLYKIQDLGVEFAKNVCIATYGSWLLMRDARDNLYIMNLFTRERIDLPSTESQLGMVKVERTIYDGIRISDTDGNSERTCKCQCKGIDIRSPGFWIDDKTKDYVVCWGLGKWSLVYSKKGDQLWNQIPGNISYGYGMVYKDHKLYFFSDSGIFKIFNFSGEIPREIFQCGDVFQGRRFRSSTKKIVVTITGDVLVVERLIRSESLDSFSIHKICNSSTGSFLKHEQVDSLGEEALFWDLGITMLANEVEGINRNSIYFSPIDNPKYLYLFNLETRKTKELLKFDFDSSLRQLRWFFPSFTHT